MIHGDISGNLWCFSLSSTDARGIQMLKKYFRTVFAVISRNISTAVLLSVSAAMAQPLSGIYSVGGSGSPDYATIAAAINDLNAKGVSGPVVFNVAAGHTETAVNLQLTAHSTYPSGATRPVVFQTAGGGPNPRINAGAGTGDFDGVIEFAGADYITFSGIDIADDTVANTTDATRMEWGYGIFAASAYAASQYITIQDCSITLKWKYKRIRGGIYSNWHSSYSGTSISVYDSAATRCCGFDRNTIRNCYNGINLTTKATNRAATNFSIGCNGGNTIESFGGGDTISYGILVSNPIGFRIENNMINGSCYNYGAYYGICVEQVAKSGLVSGNQIALKSGSMNKEVVGIRFIGSGSAINGTCSVNDNVIWSMEQPGSTSASLYGIYCNTERDTLTVCGNTVDSLNGCGSSYMYGIYVRPPRGKCRIDSNIVRNLIKTSTASAQFAGIYCQYFTNASDTRINYNDIQNMSATYSALGIYSTGGIADTIEILGNIVHSINSDSAGVIGILHTAGLLCRVIQNRLYNLNASGSSTTASACGIWTTDDNRGYICNNMVSDLRAPKSRNSTAIAGIRTSGSSSAYSCWYNTVMLKAQSTSTMTFGSSCVENGSSTIDLRNNLLINMSSTGPSPSDCASAFCMLHTSGLSLYSDSSNYNCYYVTSGDTSRALMFVNSTALMIRTIGKLKKYAYPRDSMSISELPPMVNINNAPYDLHLTGGIPTGCESGAIKVLNVFPIDDDYDREVRCGSSGYAGTGKSPDIGMDEYDCKPPALFRTVSDGNWTDIGIWQMSNDNGSNWVAATTYPTYSNSNEISVLHSTTITTPVRMDQVVFAAGTLLTLDTATVYVGNGPGVDMTMNGEMRMKNGSALLHDVDSVTININNKVHYEQNGGAIPYASWNAGSELRITGLTNKAPAGMDQAFYDVIWNNTGQTVSLTMTGSMQINNLLALNAGTMAIGTNTLTLNGSLSITGTGSLSGSTTSNMIVGGNGPSLTLPGLSLKDLSVTNNNGIIIGAGLSIYGVMSAVGGIIELGSNALTIIGSIDACNSTLSGNSGSSIIYNGIIKGNIPGGTVGTMQLNSSAGAGLCGNLNLLNGLNMYLGLLWLDIYNLELGPAAVVNGTPGTTKMVVSGVAGEFRKKFNSTGSFTFTVGTYTDMPEYSPITVTFTSGSFGSGAYMGVSAFAIKHTYNPSATNYLERYWSLNPSSISNFSYNLSAKYETADIIGDESGISSAMWNGANWTRYSPAGASNNLLTATGISCPGAFTGGSSPVINAQVIVKAKVLLEGPFDGVSAMSTYLIPDPSDSTTVLLPLIHPYGGATAYGSGYNGAVSHMGSENIVSKYWFTQHPAVVDWLMMEIRTGDPAVSMTTEQTRACLLLSDGSVVDLDGESPVAFDSVTVGGHYIVLRHRNHLALMSADTVHLYVNTPLYNFTSSLLKVYGNDARDLATTGVYGMYSGDGNSDGGIDFMDRVDVWLTDNGGSGYLYGDFNLDGGCDFTDRVSYWLPNNGGATQVQ
jgi:hypothetical protein